MQVFVCAHIAELATVMQSLGTVQALYPSKISHSISSDATCHCVAHFLTKSHYCKHAYQKHSSICFLYELYKRLPDILCVGVGGFTLNFDLTLFFTLLTFSCHFSDTIGWIVLAAELKCDPSQYVTTESHACQEADS